jgi:hypothetical protein
MLESNRMETELNESKMFLLVQKNPWRNIKESSIRDGHTFLFWPKAQILICMRL